jgi:hypothetical protein
VQPPKSKQRASTARAGKPGRDLAVAGVTTTTTSSDIVARMAGLLSQCPALEVVNTQWEGSPFEKIRTLSSRGKGSLAEQWISAWAESEGLCVTRSASSEVDRIIAGRKVEIKFSSLWENGNYRFQQIRNQGYEYCLCLGVSPYAVAAWLIPKKVLRKQSTGQHTGKKAKETLWLAFPAKKVPAWMAPYGGTLDDVARLLREVETATADG